MPADALASRRLRGGFAPPSPAHLAGWLWPLTGGHRWPGAGSPHGLRERAPGRTSPEGALLLLSMRDGRKQSACPPPSRPCCLVHEAGCGQLAGQALGQRRSAAHVARVAHGLAPRSAGYRAKEDGRASQLVTHAAAHAAARRRASTAANCAARFASGPAARASKAWT